MKKRYIIVPAALALLFSVCMGCADNQLPEGFDKDTVVKSAESSISLLNEGKYEDCYELFTDVMKESMSVKKLETTFNSIFEGLGQFVRFKSASVSSSESLGREYAVCIVKCQYENGTASYTLSLEKDMKIAGLYVK